jgi:SAM-dependent methyltransferase
MPGWKQQVFTYRRMAQVRYVAWSAVDLVDRVRGRTDPELPPKRLRDWIGGGDFRAIGEEMVGYLQRLADLQPTDRVLDVGSGIGRIAIPLTHVLDGGGGYDGIEIVKQGVRWCDRHITPAHPSFRFHHADVRNATYNPRGKVRAEEYRFPFADDSFDVAVLTSVFTHLLHATVEHYIAELGRVLRPGGRVMGTWLLLNEEAERALAAGQSTLTLAHRLQNARVENPYSPEDAIAYPEPFVRDAFARNGLRVREPIHYGSWPGRTGLSFQDIVIAEKPSQ